MTDEMQSEPAPEPPPPPGNPRTGPPWESQRAAIDAFIATARGVLLEPTMFFDTMRRDGGLGPPLAYGVIGISAGMLVSMMYQTVFHGFGMPFVPFQLRDMAVGVAGIFVWAIVAPILALVILFVNSAIYHVLLMLFGGARQSYETTFRVTAYAAGSTILLSILPICGGLIGSIWNIVVSIIGLARAHETTTGKAAAAVLVPMLLCCLIVMFFFAAFVALIMAGVKGANQL